MAGTVIEIKPSVSWLIPLSRINCIQGREMRYNRVERREIGALLLVLWSVAAAGQAPAQQFDSGGASYSAPNARLPVEQVARKLEERNAQRAAALNQFSSTRVYRMQYHGFPSDRDAEMVVNVTYHAPNG